MADVNKGMESVGELGIGAGGGWKAEGLKGNGVRQGWHARVGRHISQGQWTCCNCVYQGTMDSSEDRYDMHRIVCYEG